MSWVLPRCQLGAQELPWARQGWGWLLALTSLVCQLLEAAQMQAARGRRPCPRQSAPAAAGEELAPRPPLLTQRKWSHLCGHCSPYHCPWALPQPAPQHGPSAAPVQLPSSNPSPSARPCPGPPCLAEPHEQPAGLGRKDVAWTASHARGRCHQHNGCHAAALCWPWGMGTHNPAQVCKCSSSSQQSSPW